jgi:flagellar protein FliS
MQRAASAYLQTQITTTSQGDLVVMLYDGAIKFLNQAKEYLAANDMAQKGIAISKSLDVLNELDSTLDMEKGGSLARNLHSLYLFCSNHLVKANLKKSPAMIDEVIRVLSGLRAAYAQILTTPEAQAASQQAAANLRATAILPPRVQAGTAPSGGENPAPGANARIRSMYARQGESAPAALEESAKSAMAQPPESSATEIPFPQAPGRSFGTRAQAELLRKFNVS